LINQQAPRIFPPNYKVGVDSDFKIIDFKIIDITIIDITINTTKIKSLNKVSQACIDFLIIIRYYRLFNPQFSNLLRHNRLRLSIKAEYAHYAIYYIYSIYLFIYNRV